MFIHEWMRYVGEGSTSQYVQIAGDGAALLALLNIKVPKNGYCIVFVSNESGEYVYFDDMIVRHDRDRILEENHYYAFGLKIASLSSRSFGASNNAYGYQGEFNELDEDLGWHDFSLRNYDPQIGRFLQADPYDQFASGYVGMGNDPVNMIDPSGGFAGMGVGASMLTGTVGGTIVGGTIGLLTSKNGNGAGKGALFGAMAGATIGLASSLDFKSWFGVATQVVTDISLHLITNSITPDISGVQNGNQTPVTQVQYTPKNNGLDYSGYRKNGKVYTYSGGTVQNYTKINGNPEVDKFAEFTDYAGKITRFPGASITDYGVVKRAGVTTANKSIHAHSSFSLADLQHEYGHVLQRTMYGLAKYTVIMAQSIYSATFDPENHFQFWTEKDANAWTVFFFGIDSDISKFRTYFPIEFSVYFKEFINSL